MHYVSLNIETIANEQLREQLPEPEIKLGNLKDPLKIEARKQEARNAQSQHMALDPFYGQVLCASMAIRKEAGIRCITLACDHHDEADILRWVWKQLRVENRALVTFNGAAFDVPFLQIRSMLLLHGDEHPQLPHIETGKYKVLNPAGSHFDIMAYFHQLNNPLSTVRNLAYYVRQVLGEEFPYADIDQSRLDAIEISKVIALCEWNTTRTLALYERIRRVLP